MAIRECCKTFLYLQFCSVYTILSRGAGCICKVVSYDWNTFIGLDWPQEPIHFRELMGLSMCQVCNQAARRSVDLIVSKPPISMLTSMTILGDLLLFGQLLKACGNNYLAQISHILRQRCQNFSFFKCNHLWAAFIGIWQL